jgi:hypothetical protein
MNLILKNKIMRPEFPRCVMTPEIIRHISQEQDYYDEDPERYERQEQERMECERQEQERMEQERIESERLEQERQNNNIQDETFLPF